MSRIFDPTQLAHTLPLVDAGLILAYQAAVSNMPEAKKRKYPIKHGRPIDTQGDTADAIVTNGYSMPPVRFA